MERDGERDGERERERAREVRTRARSCMVVSGRPPLGALSLSARCRRQWRPAPASLRRSGGGWPRRCRQEWRPACARQEKRRRRGRRGGGAASRREGLVTK
eukprot:3276265-Pleurochrysis_carterae.AAC.4